MSYHEFLKKEFGEFEKFSEHSSEKDLAEGTFLEKWPDFIRWVLFLPAAFIIALVGQLLFYLIQVSFQGIQEGSLVHGLINLARTGVMFGLFIWIGAYVAPKYQFAVSILMLILATIFTSLLIFGVFLVNNSLYAGADKLYYLLHILVALGVSGFVVYAIKEELE